MLFKWRGSSIARAVLPRVLVVTAWSAVLATLGRRLPMSPVGLLPMGTAIGLLLVFRMIKRARGIQVMISAILTALPALFNVFSMLFLNFFVFAILGMTLFGNVKYGGALNNNANFRDFGSSFSVIWAGY